MDNILFKLIGVAWFILATLYTAYNLPDATQTLFEILGK